MHVSICDGSGVLPALPGWEFQLWGSFETALIEMSKFLFPEPNA